MRRRFAVAAAALSLASAACTSGHHSGAQRTGPSTLVSLSPAQFLDRATQACSAVHRPSASPMPNDVPHLVQALAAVALSTQPGLEAIQALPRPDPPLPSPGGVDQQHMLTDWNQWLTNASALRTGSFATTDRVRDAWDQASQPAYKARQFFLDQGVSACVALFPNGQ